MLTAGLVAFLVARYALSDDSAVLAQVDPAGTPQVREMPPHPMIAAVMTATALDRAKPRFAGELNGITFVENGGFIPEIPGCPRSSLKDVDPTQAASAVRSSSVDFTASYIPVGYSLTHETATKCGDGTVVAAGRAYDPPPPIQASLGQPFHPISISRIKGPAYLNVLAPQDRLTAMSIAGREAVVVSPIFDGDFTFTFMHDDQGTFWSVSADLPTAEVIKIAEGLK